jgi:hypothetical protein
LSPDQILELDTREAAERAVIGKSAQLHLSLFPEEYDFYYDSGSDSKDRNRGINPMSQEYISRTNARRLELGFGAFSVVDMPIPNPTVGWSHNHNTTTLAWVIGMVRGGKEDQLVKIIQGRQAVDDIRADVT